MSIPTFTMQFLVVVIPKSRGGFVVVLRRGWSHTHRWLQLSLSMVTATFK